MRFVFFHEMLELRLRLIQVYYERLKGGKVSVRQKRIDYLEKQVAKMNLKISQERALESKQARKDDTRRKILLGAILLDKAQHAESPEAWLKEFTDPYLTRDTDRALFDLAPLGNE